MFTDPSGHIGCGMKSEPWGTPVQMRGGNPTCSVYIWKHWATRGHLGVGRIHCRSSRARWIIWFKIVENKMHIQGCEDWNWASDVTGSQREQNKVFFLTSSKPLSSFLKAANRRKEETIRLAPPTSFEERAEWNVKAETEMQKLVRIFRLEFVKAAEEEFTPVGEIRFSF